MLQINYLPVAFRLLMLPFFVVMTGCNSNHQDAQSETSRLNDWLDEKYEEQLQMIQMRLTMLGRKDQYDRIDDMTEEAGDRRLEWQKETVSQLQERFNYDDLDHDGQLSYDLWRYQFEIAEAGHEFRRHHYVFDHMRSVHTQLPNFLINFHRVDDASDMEAYIARIESVSGAIYQLLERSQRQAAEDIRPPLFVYETVITQAEALLNGRPFNENDTDSPLLADASAKIDSLHVKGEISEDEAQVLMDETERALLTHFQPAYNDLLSWVRSDMENAVEKPVGVSRHPRGEEFYRHQLLFSTTTGLTAHEIHEIGLAEVDRVKDEMRKIMKQIGFEGSLEDFFTYTSTDEQFFYPDTDEGREGYLRDSRNFLEGIEAQLPNYFGILPKAGLLVSRVEAFREQDGAPQHYMPGTPDGSRPGVYYAHLSDMSSMPKPMMEAVAYHEGSPGHHMQISIAQELESVPQFRTQEWSTVYVEGWALYTEKLAKEMGGYEDPYSDFGRLVPEMWRAIRLVVDTGLHAKGWTEEVAVSYMSENSPIAEGAIRAEIRRYMVMPGQVTAYKIGMIKIEELRSHAEQELGDRFDIREFHDTILGGGSMPLHLLEQQVNRWIDSRRAG